MDLTFQTNQKDLNIIRASKYSFVLTFIFLWIMGLGVPNQLSAQIQRDAHTELENDDISEATLSIKNKRSTAFTSSYLSIYNDAKYRFDIGVQSSQSLLGPNRYYLSAWNNRPIDFLTGLKERRMSIDSLGRLSIIGDELLRDTIVKIVTEVSGPHEVVGISSESFPDGATSLWGIGGVFKGGWRGVIAESNGGYGVTGTSVESSGVKGESTNEHGIFGTSNHFLKAGVYGSNTNDFGFGVWGKGVKEAGVFGASTAGSGVKGYSASSAGVLGESGTSVGVKGTSTMSNGVFGVSTSGDAGVRGEGTTGVEGIGMSGGPGVSGFSQLGHGVIGHALGGHTPKKFDFYAVGSAMDYGSSSSRRWKSNIQNIDDPLEKITKLRGVYYDWDEEHGGGRHDIGFIAEEVGEVIPEIVSYEENNVDAIALDYSKITPLLVEAFNTLKQEYDATLIKHEQEISALKNMLNNLLEDKELNQ